ncbi:MAG: hypothetical protein JXB30_02450 [Anaerolineae bacterium]|nr:hypothetical protein [Anaerolineae bacterium]
MKTQNGQRRIKYRMTVKLDVEWDADLIAWLEGIAPGSRSALIRDTLRTGLKQPTRWEPVDIEEMRRVVAEELSRALAGKQVAGGAETPAEEDIEGKYGAKLDRMLGGLAAGCAKEDDG